MKRFILTLLLIPLSATAGFLGDFVKLGPFSGGISGICREQKPVVAVTPTDYAFGNQSTGTTRVANIALSNTGNAALTGITFGTFSSAVFAHSSSASAPCGATLAAKATCNRKVSFTPALVASYTGTLVIDSDQLAVRTVNVTGTGTSSVASDNFTYSNGNLETVSGGKWVKHSTYTDLIVTNNALDMPAASAESAAYWVSTDLTDDHCSQITIVAVGTGNSSPTVRVSTTDKQHYRIAGGVLSYVNASGSTSSMVAAFTPTTGDIVKLCAKGSTISAQRNSDAPISVTDTRLTTGKAGIFERYQDTVLDNWVGSIAP